MMPSFQSNKKASPSRRRDNRSNVSIIPITIYTMILYIENIKLRVNTHRLIAGEYDFKKYHGMKYLKVLRNDKAFGEYITNMKVDRDRLPTI